MYQVLLVEKLGTTNNKSKLKRHRKQYLSVIKVLIKFRKSKIDD